MWSAPALDPERNRLYITTGDSYSSPAAPESDAIMALAMDTGRVLWIRQTLPGDAWNTGCLASTPAEKVNCPSQAGPDHDFGSSPALVTTSSGQRVLLAGQKSGAMFGINPDTGDVLWKTQVGDGGVLGGIEWGFATDGAGRVRVALERVGEEARTGRWSGGCERRRRIAALGGAACGEHVRGPARVQHRAAGRRVVDSRRRVLGQPRWSLRAYDSGNGKVLLDVNTINEYDTVNDVPARGGSINGPGATIAGGMVFVNSGYSSIGFMPGNVLLAFSVDGK